MRQRDRGDGRPRCWGKELSKWTRVIDTIVYPGDPFIVVPKEVSIPFTMTRECRAWASDPSTDPVPLAEDWRCDGCCRYPAELVELALQRREARRR